MSKPVFDIVDRLVQSLRAGDIESCERLVVAQMKTLPSSPFHIALELSFSNDPGQAATQFDRFFLAEAQRFKVAAAYTEMNGFHITLTAGIATCSPTRTTAAAMRTAITTGSSMPPRFRLRDTS